MKEMQNLFKQENKLNVTLFGYIWFSSSLNLHLSRSFPANFSLPSFNHCPWWHHFIPFVDHQPWCYRAETGIWKNLKIENRLLRWSNQEIHTLFLLFWCCAMPYRARSTANICTMHRSMLCVHSFNHKVNVIHHTQQCRVHPSSSRVSAATIMWSRAHCSRISGVVIICLLFRRTPRTRILAFHSFILLCIALNVKWVRGMLSSMCW